MESSRTASTSSNGSEKSRRRNTDYLQIDPSSTFINNTGRGFEELPENFLDTISPHPVAPAGSSTENAVSSRDEVPTSSAPQLASLTPMSISNEQPSSSFSGASLLSTSYRHIKNEPENDYRFSGSTAGLLSPLSSDSRRRASHDFNSSPFIKEEEDLDAAHLLMGDLQQQELDHLEEEREGSPNEAASISSMITGDHVVNRSPTPQRYSADPTPMIQRQLIKNEQEATSRYSKPTRSSYAKSRRNGHDQDSEDFVPGKTYSRNSRKQKKPLGVLNQAASSSAAVANSSSGGVGSNVATPASAHVVSARRVYSTQDSNDPLNAEIGEDIYIDTKDLCKRIAFELKTHSIPQAIFAERILCRSQGTLSDLLRNPKPWNKLKSGRETFRRMYNWVSQPLQTRLAILDMKTDESGRSAGMSPPTPAQNVRTHRKSTSEHDNGPTSKRPRLVFTDIQKRTLQAIFKETQRPSREMQQTIAEHLRLDLSTVANFFMNARRRSRLGTNIDEPTPYQQIRNITPPPGADPNGQDHGPLLGAVMAEMLYKPDSRPEITAEQRQLIERGFGVPRAHSHTISVQQNGAHPEEEEEELLEEEEDEMNDEELAFEEDVDVGDEEEEEEVVANGDILPKEEVEEKEVKEEVPDDDEYGKAAASEATEVKVAATL